MTTLDWTGVHVILVTPFTGDGSEIDHPALEAHVDRLVGAGIRTLVVGGNTSEYFSLDERERTAAIGTVIAANAGRATVIAGIGAVTQQAAGEARSAQRLGVEAVMVHTPSQPFVTADGWLAYHDGIAGATDLPLLPYVRAAALDPEAVSRLARRDYAVAIKYAVPDPLRFGTAVAAAPTDTTWICGLAESWAPAFWALGARGFTSGLANVVPSTALRFWAALDAGDLATVRALWARIRPFESLRARQGDGWNVAVIKGGMRQLGHDVGRVRPPSSDVPDAFADEFAAAVRLLVSAGEAAGS